MAATMEREVTETRHTGVMSEMNGNGDTKVMWDKDNADEVAAAKAAFEKLTKDRRFTAFRVDTKGEKSEIMRTFDPEAEKVILVPQVRGG